MTGTRTDLETVHYTVLADGVAIIALNRPDHANGVVPELARDLGDAIAALEADVDHVRAVVLTGEGRQFCAGADLGKMLTYIDEELPRTGEPYNARVLFPITQRITTSRLPFVAAINGGATAGGLDLALACDIRIASSRAKLGETYIKLGLTPGNGGMYFLPRLVGSGVAAELALTGDIVDAATALRLGLVTHVVEPDDLIVEAVALATRIAAHPRKAVEATKQALRATWQHDLASSMASSFWAVSALFHTDDLREGVLSAIEKRPPVFNRTPGATPDPR
jgi:enoyl-CoA hydratase/carnithine racemase